MGKVIDEKFYIFQKGLFRRLLHECVWMLSVMVWPTQHPLTPPTDIWWKRKVTSHVTPPSSITPSFVFHKIFFVIHKWAFFSYFHFYSRLTNYFSHLWFLITFWFPYHQKNNTTKNVKSEQISHNFTIICISNSFSTLAYAFG